MSIREYFQKYPPEALRLHDLTIEREEKRERLVFNPETEIFDSDWQEMKAKLQKYRQNKNWWDFSWLAMEMKILFPDRSQELELNEEDWQGMRAALEEYRQNKDWGNFSWFAMKMKILAAFKAQITNQGIECQTRPFKFKPKPKIPRPERRAF
ncbi:MAG: hypothetical protein AB1465_06320 [Patescibacteria group bacterium]